LQAVIAANVMPAGAAVSWFAKGKWIAGQIKDKKKVRVGSHVTLRRVPAMCPFVQCAVRLSLASKLLTG
jgi:hypothetical protein